MRITKENIVLLIAFTSIVIGCESNGKNENLLEQVELTQLVKFGQNLITDSPKRVSVVRNQEQFEVEWNRISSEQIPEIEFRSERVVIAEMGYQSSGRGVIEITDVLTSGGHTEVHIKTSVVGTNCDVTAELNSPYHVISYPYTAIDVIIKEEYEITDCQ